VATHGVQGELILKHVLGKNSDFKNVEALFIEERKDACLPYFHQKSIVRNSAETIIKLEGVDTKDAEAKLLQKKVWLRKKDFEKLVNKTAPVNLLGFIVLNDGENLGRVEAVIEQPLQVLLQVKVRGKEVLIPLHEETLKKINRRKKEVYVSLPDGLLEIYLEK
jgi:16S rRNA processing protein RimM